VAAAEGRCRFHRVAQLGDQLLLVPYRGMTAFARAIDGQRLFQGGKDVAVVDDHAAVLAGEYLVGPGYYPLSTRNCFRLVKTVLLVFSWLHFECTYRSETLFNVVFCSQIDYSV